MAHTLNRLCRYSLVLLAVAGGVRGEEELPASFEAGLEAYNSMDYALAEKIWLELARNGERNAQFQLATLYDNGLIVTQKKDGLAFKWYEQAALQGHAAASFNLGNAYKHGRGTFKSGELANFWWQKAADAGIANAQYNLAIQYYRGEGAPKDEQKATAYFNLAASNGHEKAMALIRDGKVPRLDKLETPPLDPASSQPGVMPDGVENSTPHVRQQEQKPVQQSVADPRAESEAGDSPKTKPKQGTGHKWLHKQPPESYTLQLAVASNREAAESFVKKHHLEAQVKIVILNREGKTYYHLLMGGFADRDRALARLAQLSAEVKKSKPWPRKFRELQLLAGARQ